MQAEEEEEEAIQEKRYNFPLFQDLPPTPGSLCSPQRSCAPWRLLAAVQSAQKPLSCGSGAAAPLRKYLDFKITLKTTNRRKQLALSKGWCNGTGGLSVLESLVAAAFSFAVFSFFLFVFFSVLNALCLKNVDLRKNTLLCQFCCLSMK